MAEPEEHQNVSCIPEFIKKITAIDLENGVRHFPNEQMYLDMLKIYAVNLNENISNIEKLWNHKNIREFAIKVHAFKSSSRSIGAAELGELAQKLETAGNNNDIKTISDNIDVFISDIRKLDKELEPLRETDEKNDAKLIEITDNELQDLYAQIKDKLDNFDFDSAGELVKKLSNYKIPDNEIKRCEMLEKSLDDFDFETMINIMKKE